ncbi:MAG: PLDc N-terminal domain-containing protein [Pseudomonadota bacterium]
MESLNQVAAAFGFDLNTIAVVVGLTIPFVALSLGCIVHAAGREFATDGQKMLWVLVAGIPFIGFFIYLAVGLRKSKKPDAGD